MDRNRLRVSAISFLNTVPLVYDFTHEPKRTELARDFATHFTLPSMCAEELAGGAADIGIIPVAAYASIPDLRIVSGVAIAAKHPVRSILLLSKRPPDQVRTVATDTSSRTSVALLRVLYERKFGARPQFIAEPPHPQAMLARHDAALVIGDPALAIDPETIGLACYDLAREWQQMTGLPFVFAFWAVRGHAAARALEGNAATVLQQSRDHGLERVNELCAEEAGYLGLSRAAIHRYLSYHIDYSLDEQNIEGLRLFFRYAAACAALPEAPELRFL